METARKHPLDKYSEKEQVAYLSIIASLCYADKYFGEEERKKLDEFMNEFNISDAGKARVYAAIFSFQDDEKDSAIQMLRALKDTDLRFTLISDLFLIANIDNSFAVGEQEYIYDIAKRLNISEEQVEAIRIFQENIMKLQCVPSSSERFKALTKEISVSLASVGVPLAAVAASGTVFGLSAAGITSGLAALGALVGGGMLAGTVFVVPALALGSAFGARKLVNLIWKDHNNEKVI